MKLSPRLFPIALLIPTILCTPLVAQDDPAPEKPAAITSADPKIDVTHLEFLLDPLTKSELEVEAAAWQSRVKTSVGELSQLYIDASKQENEEAKQKVLEKLSEVQDTKTARLKRFDSVLKELEEKGGDTTDYRTYFKAVSGVSARGGDSDAQISAISGWLKSEDGGIKWAKAIGKCIAILIAFWILAAILARLTHRITDRLNWSELLERFINKLVKRAVLVIGVLVALSSIGVNVGAVLALIGGGAFIIGFALQDTLGNFAAGLMLLIYRPFDVGDFVETAGVMGKVDNVSLVSTSIRTPDNKLILVPNKNVWGQVITNATASSERRVDMVFGIGYDDDMAKAQEILEKILSEHEKVLEDPAPVVKVNELADSSVNFVCRPWSKTGDYWDVYWDVTRKAKEEFDANGISIPFPQQDVHMHQVAGS